jgi:hypothetical protein
MKSKKQKNAIEDECITLGFTNDNFGSNAVQILNKICKAISIGFSVRYGEVVYKGVKINSMEKYEESLVKINGKDMPRQRFIFTSIIDWFVNNLKKDPEKIENFKSLPDANINQKVGSLFDFFRNTKFKNKTLSKFFFDFYNKKAQKKQWSLPCDRKKLIAIHLRMRMPPAEIRGTIEKGGYQNYCGVDHLRKVIRRLRDKYKNHKIYLIVDPRFLTGHFAKNNEKMKEIYKMLGDEGWGDMENNIIGSEDADKDLWIMMCADILVCDGSNFSLYCAVLNQGSERYIMKWFRGIVNYLSFENKHFYEKNKKKKYSYDLQKKVLDKTLEGEKYIKRFKLKND